MLGTNLAPPDYYSGSFAFVDAMHHADPFHSGTLEEWNDGRKLALDGQGWVKHLEPGQLARTFIYAGEIEHPTGAMTVLYEGRGVIEYKGLVTDLVRSPGRDTFVLGGKQGLYLEITEVDASDHLRNIRVLQPGGRCADDIKRLCQDGSDCNDGQTCRPFVADFTTQPFYPPFLAELAPYSVLRFMDWMQTNREVVLKDGVEEPAPVTRWAELPTTNSWSWKPVPLAVMVDLANTVGADPWITIPHAADDDFVRRLAITLRDRLDPRLKVYVEYSNETWNAIFDQHRWVNARGCEASSDDPNAECGRDGDGLCPSGGSWNAKKESCTNFGRLYHGRRTAQVMDLFAEVFGSALDARVVRVLAGQIGTVGHHGKAMLEAEWKGRPVADRVDAFAIAPYFGSDDMDRLDDAFAVYKGQVHDAPPGTHRLLAGDPADESGGLYKWIKSDVEALKAYPNVDLVGYEGGQHFFSFDTQRAKIFHLINRDPRMKDLYLQYLGMWSQLTGGSLLVHFTSPSSWTQFGCFGVKEYLGQPLGNAPKADAIVSFAAAKVEPKSEAKSSGEAASTPSP